LLLMPVAKHSEILRFLPQDIELNSLAAVKPVADQALAVAHPLSAWAGFAVLCLYAAIALVAGAWALLRRDA